MPKLTKRVVDVAGPRENQYTIWDSETRGFGLRVTPAGVKSFIVDYRTTSGQRRRLTLDRFGTLTCDQARDRARVVLGQVAQGLDPLDVLRRTKEAPTMKELGREYFARHADLHKKPKSIAEDHRLLDDCILPDLKDHKVGEVTRSDVARLHSKMSKTPTQANRAVALLSKMFSLAELWGYRPDHSNPCYHVQRYPEARRKRYMSAEEVKRLGIVLENEEAKSPACVLAVRLLLLTGMRLSEVLGLRWESVDLQGGVIHLPDSKTGEKDVQLGAAAVQLLLDAPKDSEWVVPSSRRRGRPMTNLNGFWEKVRTDADIEDVRLHDLRHTFGATGAGAGLSLVIVGGLLGHSQPATTARYAHAAPSPQRAAADAISGELAAQLASRDPAEVVDMRSRTGK